MTRSGVHDVYTATLVRDASRARVSAIFRAMALEAGAIEGPDGRLTYVDAGIVGRIARAACTVAKAEARAARAAAALADREGGV